jgi:nicotinamidase-related amidase
MSEELCIKERCAVVVCDLQPDLLKSIAPKSREALISALELALGVARSAGALVVFSGLRFPRGYVGVSPRHKLYGGLIKLNAKVGDQAAHWFMEGFPGAVPALMAEGDLVAWRQQHLPTGELCDILRERGVRKVMLTGIKAGFAVQATCQVLCDQGLQVSVVRECVQDDDAARLAAVLDHLLPVYADVISLPDMIDSLVGIESFVDHADEQSRQALTGLASASAGGGESGQRVFHCTDCGRGGHGKRFIQFLLERPGWQSYPTQAWYQRGMDEFFCTLGKKVVDFADEPEFSQLAMYLAGREWLDEKDKAVHVAGEFMPETFVFEQGRWAGGREPPADEEEHAAAASWFVKEADKNFGGDSVKLCRRPSEVAGLLKPEQSYVVQQHIRDPLLTADGRKAHLKFYALLICEATHQDDPTPMWTLYTYKSSHLCISTTEWSAASICPEAQVTIDRHVVPAHEAEAWKEHWPSTYSKCKAATAAVIRNAVARGRLKGRVGKRQFEVFTADWLPDSHGRVWLLEFNMSPAVCQQRFDDAAHRDARRDGLMAHDEAMMRDALGIALPWEGGAGLGLWDLAGEFTGASQ